MYHVFIPCNRYGHAWDTYLQEVCLSGDTKKAIQLIIMWKYKEGCKKQMEKSPSSKKENNTDNHGGKN